MGNSSSSSTSRSRRRGRDTDGISSRAQKVVGQGVRDIQVGIQNSIKKLEENDHPAAQLLDTMCGPYLDGDGDRDRRYGDGEASFYSEDVSEDDSRTISEDETTTTADYRRSKKEDRSVDTSSYMSQSDFDPEESTAASEPPRRKNKDKKDKRKDESSYLSEDDSYRNSGVVTQVEEVGGGSGLQKPLASSFAKRCYFTKSGIGKATQHYEGLTLTGNVVLMLAAAMKLKGCPTICDEDLRRVEQTYPNQFSRLPDELLLSSGWRRISKYCHFSNKPIPDGIPFFHSKQRLHQSGGYYFLLASAVGMVRPIDVEPLTRDTLVLLETDFSTACDAAPDILIKDPDQWTLVDKFCFFSGGPINTDEDVYYQADFDGNPIYMLAFLSPSLTPAELYKLDSDSGDVGLKSVAAVDEVESVYDLTDRDFADLKLYHLGPCRALPKYILQPQAWTKVLPPHFLAARQKAMLRAQEYDNRRGAVPAATSSHSQDPFQQRHSAGSSQSAYVEPSEQDYYAGQQYSGEHGQLPPSPVVQRHPDPYPTSNLQQQQQLQPQQQQHMPQQHAPTPSLGPAMRQEFQREMDEEGAFIDPNVPIDEAIAARASRTPPPSAPPARMDPPEDQPPSLSRRDNGSVVSGSVVSGSVVSGSAVSFQGGRSATSGDQSSYEQHAADYYESTENEYYAASHEQSAGNEYYPSPDKAENEYYPPPDKAENEYYPSPDKPENEYYPSPDKPENEYYPSPDKAENEYYPSPDKAENEYYPSPDKAENEYYPSPDKGGENDYYAAHDDNNVAVDDAYYGSLDKNAVAENGYYSSPDKNVDNEYYSRGDNYYDPPDDGGNFVVTGQEENPISPVSEPASEPGFGDGDFSQDHSADPSIDKEDNSPAKYTVSPDYSQRRKPQLPPASPRSPPESEFTQSSAMRGAQLLRRNRQRRLEMAKKKEHQQIRMETTPESQEVSDPAFAGSPGSETDSGTWESSSELTSVVSASSAWTENSSNPDRSSRRALILQMAKARMKGNKQGNSPSAGDEEDDRRTAAVAEESYDDGEEKKLDLQGDVGADIDLTEDLD